MRILIVGATGRVGSAAAAALARKHEVVKVGRSSDPSVDLHDSHSITRSLEVLGKFDAIVCAYGSAPFKPATELTPHDLQSAFAGKVLSQFNLVHVGLDHLNDGGSITLTSGVLARESVARGAAAAMANGAVESFVMSAAPEMPRGIRLNVVSPTVLQSAPEYHDVFPGFEPVSGERLGRAFVRAVEGNTTGRTFAVD